MTGLRFRARAHLKRRIGATGLMMSSMPVATYELSTHVATVVMPVATIVMSIANVVMPIATDLKK
jgi:hypothetical protein